MAITQPCSLEGTHFYIYWWLCGAKYGTILWTILCETCTPLSWSIPRCIAPCQPLFNPWFLFFLGEKKLLGSVPVEGVCVGRKKKGKKERRRTRRALAAGRSPRQARKGTTNRTYYWDRRWTGRQPGGNRGLKGRDNRGASGRVDRVRLNIFLYQQWRSERVVQVGGLAATRRIESSSYRIVESIWDGNGAVR